MDVIRHFVKVGLHFLFSHVASTLTLLMNRLNILPREQANSEFVKFLLSKEAKRKSFLVKVSFLCVRITDHFHIIGFALCLAPKQRLGAFRKWPCFVVCIDWKGIFNCNCLEQRWLFRKELFISRGCRGRALSYVSRKSTTLEQFRFSRRKPHIFSVKLTRCMVYGHRLIRTLFYVWRNKFSCFANLSLRTLVLIRALSMTEYLIIGNLTETLNDFSKVLSNVNSTWLSCKLKPSVQSKVTDFFVGFQEKYSKGSFNLRLWYVLKDELVKLRANR